MQLNKEQNRQYKESRFIQIKSFIVISNQQKMKQSISSPTRQAQYKKIFCAYHPTQFLTNFCLQKQCLMPLCPSCVVEHTQQHYEVKQKPTYVNLNDALTDVKMKCYDQVSELQDYYRVNEQIMNYIQGLKLYIKKQLTICKQTVFDHITILFQQYETTLYKQILEKYRQQQVYDTQQSKQVKASILENIESLYDKTSLLKGDQCLSALIKYYGEDQEIVDNNVSVIKEYLDKNKSAGGIHIGLDQDQLFDSLKGICDKVIALKTITEKDLLEQTKGTKNGQGGISSARKPITISSRLRSPHGPNKKGNVKKDAYESPFKQKSYRLQRQVRSNKPGHVYQ